VAAASELLFHLERPAADEPDGLLVLHHGRGTDERDLLGLADALDPRRRLRVVTPRAPLRLPGSPGYHWYLVPRVGFPDPVTFEAARRELADLHDSLWQEGASDPSRTVLGGFSMGAVMSYAMALSAERPPVAGILDFSGFVPVVEGWEPALADRSGTRAFVAHGRNDPVIAVDFARRARQLLELGGLPLEYRESELGHQIDPGDLAAAARWLGETLPAAGSAG
jgi:phospholipase/carboxylesterase